MSLIFVSQALNPRNLNYTPKKPLRHNNQKNALPQSIRLELTLRLLSSRTVRRWRRDANS